MCKHCWDDTESVHHKDFIRGAEDPERFEEEVNYKPRSKNKKDKKKYPGCPGNDKGPHIFVWTTEKNRSNFFFDHYGFHKVEKKVCAGCGHVDKTRTTEEYKQRNANFKETRIRKGLRTWKWIAFEDYDEEYREKRSRYLRRHGWDDYMYSSRWTI